MVTVFAFIHRTPLKSNPINLWPLRHWQFLTIQNNNLNIHSDPWIKRETLCNFCNVFGFSPLSLMLILSSNYTFIAFSVLFVMRVSVTAKCSALLILAILGVTSVTSVSGSSSVFFLHTNLKGIVSWKIHMMDWDWQTHNFIKTEKGQYVKSINLSRKRIKMRDKIRRWHGNQPEEPPPELAVDEYIKERLDYTEDCC